MQRTFTGNIFGYIHWALGCSAAVVGWPNCTIHRKLDTSFFKKSCYTFYSNKTADGNARTSLQKSKPAKCFPPAFGYQSDADGQIAHHNDYQMIAHLH
jgi:hypothetical protein